MVMVLKLVVTFLKCVSFRMRLNSHCHARSQKGKGKKKRKIECLSNGQISKNSVHIGLKIIFIVGQRKVSTGSNKLLLAYLHKRRQTKWAILNYRNNAFDSTGEKSPEHPIQFCFTFAWIKMCAINFYKWNVPLHKDIYKQQTETTKH